MTTEGLLLTITLLLLIAWGVRTSTRVHKLERTLRPFIEVTEGRQSTLFEQLARDALEPLKVELTNSISREVLKAMLAASGQRSRNSDAIRKYPELRGLLESVIVKVIDDRVVKSSEEQVRMHVGSESFIDDVVDRINRKQI